jgi:hypothetical protein
MTPEARRQRARLGGLTTAARGTGDTESGRLAFEARFERRVREEAAARSETPSEREIARRADAARRLHFARLAFSSARARSARAAARYRRNGRAGSEISSPEPAEEAGRVRGRPG